MTLKTSLAVAAGVADHVWTMAEIVEMIDAYFEEQDAAQFELRWYLDPEGEEPPLKTP